MTEGQVVTLVAASTCFASHGWGLARFFTSPGGASRGTEAVKLGTAVSVLLHIAAILFAYSHAPWRFAAGFALYAGALALFWWCVQANRARRLSIAFSSDLPQHLVTDGPYRWVRHPFYLSYMACWIAGALATGAWWLLPAAAAMGWLYHRAAVDEEAKFARSGLAPAYAEYARRTARYLPRLGRRA